MYLIENMIDIGLPVGEEWPSQDHRTVACNIAIGNPNVRVREILDNVVQSVLRVPYELIRSVTLDDLVNDYGMDERIVFGNPEYF